MADEQAAAQPQVEPTPAPAPTIIGMSEAEAQHIAAQQHHAGWLALEEARLLHELAYVRGAAAQARSEFHLLMARAYGVDAAHDPLTIDLQARTITVQPPVPAQTAEPPAEQES